jgi:DNA-binding LytR/AlgR family response regulator
MKVILIDDEQAALDELEYNLSKYKDIDIIATFSNPQKALETCKSLRFDAMFLDIDMPGMDGISLAGQILQFKNSIDIVFVTAFNDYAVKAFELNALDYLLKPINKERLDSTIERLLSDKNKDTSAKKSLIEKLTQIEKYLKQDTIKIAAYDHEEIVLVKVSDIKYLEALSGKTFIETGYGKYITRDTLESLDNKLSGYGFFRCHRSYIVNLKHVTKLSAMFKNNYILKQDGTKGEIPVSRNMLKELKSQLGI